MVPLGVNHKDICLHYLFIYFWLEKEPKVEGIFRGTMKSIIINEARHFLRLGLKTSQICLNEGLLFEDGSDTATGQAKQEYVFTFVLFIYFLKNEKIKKDFFSSKLQGRVLFCGWFKDAQLCQVEFS